MEMKIDSLVLINAEWNIWTVVFKAVNRLYKFFFLSSVTQVSYLNNYAWFNFSFRMSTKLAIAELYKPFSLFYNFSYVV